MRRSVIFDFDGTISVGDGPVDAYARLAAELSGLDALHEEIAAARARAVEGLGSYRDGYHAVATAAAAVGIDDETLSRAYLRSRELLGTEHAPISAPPGLGEFLRRLAPHARLLLVTNAPAIRIAEALEALGADDIFDEIVCAARKPAGLEAAVRQELATGPVLSVGDIDEFDLEPARRLGADTAIVGPAAALHAGRATYAAERLELLYADIEAWATRSAVTSDPTDPTGPATTDRPDVADPTDTTSHTAAAHPTDSTSHTAATHPTTTTDAPARA